MPSWAGQDTGYVPAKEKTMIFIPSKGGSHNPKETTKKEYIELASKVFEHVSQELLQEKFKDRQVVELESNVKITSSEKRHEKDEKVLYM